MTLKMSRFQSGFFIAVAFGLLAASCESELIRKQEEQIRVQQEEIVRQRKEVQDLITARQQEEQKRRDCNRAFRDFFEKAQTDKDQEKAVSLYREGLKICPDDDVAHYELGKVLREMGRMGEATAEFEAAVRINPDFVDAKRQLESIQGKMQSAN